MKLMVDGLGNPLKFILTGGNHNEIIKAEELIKNKKYECDCRAKLYAQNPTP